MTEHHKETANGNFKQRLGLILCLIYATSYFVFIAISVYDAELMDSIMPFNLNLSVFYGLGLIFFALILATLYNKLCISHEQKINTKKQDDIGENKTAD